MIFGDVLNIRSVKELETLSNDINNQRIGVMKYLFVVMAMFLMATKVYAYEASCHTDDGKNFSILVKEKVLTVNHKYRHYYQGKTFFGWYEYSNSKYTYYTGAFSDGGFPIKVRNKWGLDAKGNCEFTGS